LIFLSSQKLPLTFHKNCSCCGLREVEKGRDRRRSFGERLAHPCTACGTLFSFQNPWSFYFMIGSVLFLLHALLMFTNPATPLFIAWIKPCIYLQHPTFAAHTSLIVFGLGCYLLTTPLSYTAHYTLIVCFVWACSFLFIALRCFTAYIFAFVNFDFSLLLISFQFFFHKYNCFLRKF